MSNRKIVREWISENIIDLRAEFIEENQKLFTKYCEEEYLRR